MDCADVFAKFDKGELVLPQGAKSFASIVWSQHPVFEGVQLKHIVTAKETDGKYSFHLVKIAGGKKIGLHVHENQLETHEVIAGSGICLNNGVKINYQSGVICIFPVNIEHEVVAGNEGLYLFAKFFPALC